MDWTSVFFYFPEKKAANANGCRICRLRKIGICSRATSRAEANKEQGITEC